MYTAPVFFVVQQFTGDATGMLRGDVVLFADEATANNAGAAPGGDLCRMVINTTTVVGEDPMTTIVNALIAKFPEGAMAPLV